jgi:HlyD family secretion protein
MTPARRHLLPAAVVLLLVAALLYAFSPRPVPVSLAEVSRGPLQVTVDEDGRTRIRERYVVSAPLGGQLRRIELEPGDRVRAGLTVLAVIEPPAPDLLDARLRAQFEAALRAAEGRLQLAESRVAGASATQERARIDLTRTAQLIQREAISPQEFDRVREAARVAAEDLKSAEYGRQIAGFEVEQARTALLRSSPEGRRDDCAWELRIRSPITGSVLRVFHEDAATVAPSTRLLEVGDPADLEAEIDVLSSDAVRIQPGARVLFEHWGGSVPLEGRVRVVEPAGFLKISALGVEEQRVNVIVDFVTPAAERSTLGHAYRVEARIVVWEGEDVLKMPVGALFRREGRWAVFALRDGRAQLTLVEVGHNNGREAEIVRGLAAGDRVIIHASDKVVDGVAVSPRK